jgi:hypothetical protein
MACARKMASPLCYIGIWASRCCLCLNSRVFERCHRATSATSTQQLPSSERNSHPSFSSLNQVRFKHVDTGSYLFSHDAKYGNPIAGQFEVAAVPNKNKNTEWVAAEGVYMPKFSEKDSEDDKEEL